MKKVLLFGIGGFVGKYLAKEFMDNGYMVLGSDIVKPEWILDDCFEKADLLDTKSVKELIMKVSPDMIVNLAAISSVGASWNIPQTTISVNVVGALNILEGARVCANTPRVMFIGSSEEYEGKDQAIDETSSLNANTPYGISKMAQERFAEIYRDRYDMKIYCVRPFNHTGIGQRDNFVLPSFCKQVAEIENSGTAGVIKVGNLSAKRDFSHVKDVVRAYRMIIESENSSRIYNVGSGLAYGLDELLEYIISLSTKRIEVQVDNERLRPVDTPVICCNNSLIKNELGWKPKYDVYDALREMYECYLKKNNEREDI